MGKKNSFKSKQKNHWVFGHAQPHIKVPIRVKKSGTFQHLEDTMILRHMIFRVLKDPMLDFTLKTS